MALNPNGVKLPVHDTGKVVAVFNNSAGGAPLHIFPNKANQSINTLPAGDPFIIQQGMIAQIQAIEFEDETIGWSADAVVSGSLNSIVGRDGGKLSFFGKTDLVTQRDHIADVPTAGAATAADNATAINLILGQLADLGLQASA